VQAQCAGRTDAGVHADAQVVSFETTSSMPASGLAACLGRWLPDDVWLVSADEADPRFDARRSALRRWYRYAIWRSSDAPSAGWQGRCLVHRAPLDVQAMRDAARGLLGTHDFATFRTAASDDRGTVRTVYAADLLEIDDSLLMFEICADAYLKQMVRAIVGSLVWVGEGRWSPTEFTDALESADRRAGGPTAPAVGLSLHHIDYPELF
jgi:tRNA pseudouridine38-40 synthase